MRAHRGGFLAGTIVLVAVLIGGIPAAAATTSSWAEWEPIDGSAGAYTTTVEVAAQPAITATMTSDSRGGGVGVISGASTWLSEGTPVGAKYGSSLDQPYLNLRPRVDNATSPSTTTYSFATPTPRSGWAFVLGDIDADSVRIHAIGADGQTLDATDLGFRGGFNYCAPGLAGKPSCTGAVDDVPVWDPVTLTLTGNAAAADTSGAAAWFEPSTPISSLTFVFTRRAGFPIYQTWFASLARDVTGVVTDVVDGPLAGVPLTLVDHNGAVVGSTSTGADGSYTFPGFVATDGYTVLVTPPAGKIVTGAAALPADLTDTDAMVDFVVRDIVPVAVSGQVTDEAGDPVAGVVVTIDGQTATTDSDGRYLFDQVPIGTHTAVLSTPDGYALTEAPPAFTIEDGDETPITGVDFQIAEKSSLSGAVRAGGVGIPGVLITATGPDGTLTTVTGAGGGYTFPGLSSGDYEVTVSTPDGYLVSGSAARDETVADVDVENVDFALIRLGTIDGTVWTDADVPVSGVVIRISGPDGDERVTTAADGSFALGALPPGTYTLAIEAPVGTTVVGDATRSVVITDAGETMSEQDFRLTAIVTTPTPIPGESGNGSAQLPATGLGPETFAWAVAGGAAALTGGALILLTRRRLARV